MTKLLKFGKKRKNHPGLVHPKEDLRKEMVTVVDFDPIEKKILASIERYDYQLSCLKVGKLTPETFKSLTVYHYGE